MKTLLAKLNNNKRRSPANGSNTSSVGGVTSLIVQCNQIAPFGTRVVFPCRYRGKRANSRLARLRNVPKSAILIAFIITGLLLEYNLSNNTYATPATLSLSISESNITAHAATNSASGSFVKSSSSTITASTDNYTGYKLIIKGSNNNYANLVNSSDSNETISSIESATTEEIFKAVGNTTYNGEWGFLPSKLNSGDNTSFLPAPDNNTGYLINETNTANTTGTSDTYTMAIGARVDASTKMGQYSNTYTVIMTANDIAYSITYNDGVVSNMPTDIANGTSPDTTITLANNIPTRNGYAFIGWCDGIITTTNDTDSCTGTTYPAGSNYSLDQLTSNNISLVAMWGPSIQDLTLSQCQVNVGVNGNQTDIGDNITVYDKRDGSDYTVRYINGECWMTQNLRITGTISAEYSNFTGDDFNVSEYDLKTNGNNECNSTNGYNNACSRIPDETDLSTIGGGVTLETVGAWYNYVAASAGTIKTDNNNTTATSDICPSSWHLPSGPNTTAGREYNKLIGNTTNVWQNPTTGLAAFGGVLSGNYDNGSLGSIGREFWWSSVAYNVIHRYILSYNNSNGQFRGNDYGRRYYGFSIRCVRSE